MTELDQKQIFDLLRQFFAPGQPVPLSQAQAVLKYRGVDCLALGYPTYHSLFADMPGYLELRQRANAPLFYDLVLLDSPAGVADQPQQAREPEQPAPAQQTDPSQQTAPDQQAQEGRCVLTEQQRSTLYRVLWEHYPLHFDIPLTDAAPLAAQFGFTPQQFFQGPGSPKTYHLFQALEPWARVEQGNSNVYYVTLEEAPEVLARTQSITGKRAGLTEEDRKKICRCLAKALPINTPILLNQLGQVLVDGNIDFRAMGFNRAPRLLPCLMEDLEQVMADPRQAGQPAETLHPALSATGPGAPGPGPGAGPG